MSETPTSDCKLVRDIADILRAMADHWHQNEEPSIAHEILELSKTSRKLATKMRRRRPKL
jgi:hypothetical protein